MNRKSQKILSLFLAVCMMLTMVPMNAFALEDAQSTDSGAQPAIGTSSVCTCTNLCTEGAVNAECPACSVNAADCEICNTQDNGSADSNADTLKDLGTATQSNAEYEVKAPCQSEAESQEYLAGIFEQESLTQEDESLFEAHLEQCAFCAEYMAQMQPMAEQYIIQKHAIKCSATYAFTINGVDAGGSCRVYEGDKVKVKITLTSVKDGYEYKRVELRSGYGATVGDNLGEIAEFTPVPGEEMTWTFTVPPKPASTYGVINVIAEEIKIDPIPAVALTSTATTMAYDTNNVGFTAKVIDTANNNAVMTDGTVQFYLNNEAVGDPVTYSSSYSGYYKGIRSYQYLDNPYLKMGENNIKVIYTAAEGGTTESNMVTVTLTKKDISYKVSAGYTTDDSTYTGTYGVGRLYFGLSGLEEDSLVKTTDFVITGTKDGKEFTPEYEYRFWNQITIKLMDAGTYTITATLKDDVTYYTASASYTVTIKKATPTVTVSSAVVQRSQGIFGGGVTLIANVGGVNNEKPTGTIQFKEGAVNIGSAVTVTEGAATYDWTGYAAGTHNITAEFTPATTGTGVNYTASKNATAYSLDIDKAVPTVTWGTTAQSTTYTGSPVLESNLTKPTVTLLSSDTFNGEIKYSYKKVGESAGESVAEYTDGLPTNAGTYEIKASVAAQGNYTAAESTNTMTLTVNKSTPSLAINTMNGKTYDGTAVTNPTAGNMAITGAAYADLTFAYSKNSNMSSPLTAAPKDAGTYYVQASIDVGDNTNAAASAAVNFTITKVSATGVSQEYPVVKTLAKDYTFDLSKLLPSISSTQEYGSVTYTVASTDNASSVLTASPTNSDIANGKLTLKVASVADKDKTATVTMSITSDNFTVTNAVITVKTVDKIPLTISHVTMAERMYNGSAYAYTGTPTFTNTTDNKAVTGVSFTKEYEGRNGTSYTKSETAPTNAGKYNLILTVSGASASTYAGALTVPFAITQKEVTVKAKDKDILVGAEIPSLANPALNTDYTVAGFIGTDTLTGTVSMSYTGTPDNTKHGSYPITISGGTVSDNYTVKYESGTLTISIDVSLITAAITAADNAKGGIAIYDTAASSVANGTKFVTTAEMTTLNTAIQTATAAKATCATLAQVQAAAKALDDAVAAFKAAIKTGTYTAPSGGGDSGGSTGGGSDSGSGGTVAPPPTTITPTNPNPPTTSEIKAPATVDKNGNASITVTDQTVADAIKKAQAEAKKHGTEKNGVAVELNVDTGKKTPDSISANLPKVVQDTLVREKVAEFTITSSLADLTFDNKALQEIQKQAGGDVTINASKADVSKLSKEARDEIGNRPVFNLSITGKDGKTISDFGGGSATVSIPYTLQPNENPNNLQAYFIDAQGKLHEVACTYDPVTKCMVFVTNHFSIYGIGYKENAPKFNDIEKHWAKNDIEFVTARGLLSGTDKATFSPDMAMTRGMFVTALGRLAGADVSGYQKSSFADIKTTDYFMGYVEWASKNGIVKGTSTTTFAPNAAISRQEMAVIMTNYAKTMNYTLPKTRTAVTFTDNANIASWAADAVKSMQMAGVIMGKDGNRFDPTATATRAEASAALRRYVELVIDKATAQGLDMNDSGKIVYYENGKLFTGTKTIDGTTYHFGNDGICVKIDAVIPDTKKYVIHKIVRGDTLWDIAIKNKCTVAEIVGLNGIKNPNNVPIGTELKIPQK